MRGSTLYLCEQLLQFIPNLSMPLDEGSELQFAEVWHVVQYFNLAVRGSPETTARTGNSWAILQFTASIRGARYKFCFVLREECSPLTLFSFFCFY